MIWLKSFAKIITDDVVLEPLLMVVVGYGVRLYSKSTRHKLVLDTAVDIVDYIEENYRKWGIKGNEKMDKFLELFTEEFKHQTGKVPTEKEIRTARIRAEAQCHRSRK